MSLGLEDESSRRCFVRSWRHSVVIRRNKLSRRRRGAHFQGRRALVIPPAPSVPWLPKRLPWRLLSLLAGRSCLFLAVSRAFGDDQLKRPSPVVVATPEVRLVTVETPAARVACMEVCQAVVC